MKIGIKLSDSIIIPVFFGHNEIEFYLSKGNHVWIQKIDFFIDDDFNPQTEEEKRAIESIDYSYYSISPFNINDTLNNQKDVIKTYKRDDHCDESKKILNDGHFITYGMKLAILENWEEVLKEEIRKGNIFGHFIHEKGIILTRKIEIIG